MRRFAGGVVVIVLLVLILMALQRSGLLDLGSGGYEAVDGDSLRRGEAQIRLQGIDAPEFRQMCSDSTGRDYACGREAAAPPGEAFGRAVSKIRKTGGRGTGRFKAIWPESHRPTIDAGVLSKPVPDFPFSPPSSEGRRWPKAG